MYVATLKIKCAIVWKCVCVCVCGGSCTSGWVLLSRTVLYESDSCERVEWSERTQLTAISLSHTCHSQGNWLLVIIPSLSLSLYIHIYICTAHAVHIHIQRNVKPWITHPTLYTMFWPKVHMLFCFYDNTFIFFLNIYCLVKKNGYVMLCKKQTTKTNRCGWLYAAHITEFEYPKV